VDSLEACYNPSTEEKNSHHSCIVRDKENFKQPKASTPMYLCNNVHVDRFIISLIKINHLRIIVWTLQSKILQLESKTLLKDSIAKFPKYKPYTSYQLTIVWGLLITNSIGFHIQSLAPIKLLFN